jgi:hypothetical protein
MGGGSLTIIGRRTANVSYLHGILRAKEHQIGSAYRKWLWLYCGVWPSLATFDVFHISQPAHTALIVKNFYLHMRR